MIFYQRKGDYKPLTIEWMADVLRVNLFGKPPTTCSLVRVMHVMRLAPSLA